ncbi:MAG: glycosyltransferase family 1 protein [Bacteroidales bacterium]|nr:glycosyltransferase family 1 protein [Bacteroidales bacterium]
MKIGFDAKRAASNLSGLGNYSRFIIDILLKTGKKDDYILFVPKEKRNVQFSKLLDNDNVKRILPSGLWKICPSLWRSYGINSSIAENNIQIYHGLSGELPANIEKTGVKTIVTIHDLIFLRYPQYYSLIDRNIYNSKFRYACHVADRIIAISECTKKDIIKFYGIPEKKIEVVYQGCDDSFKTKRSEDEKKTVSEKYNLPSTFLLSVGSIEERKNLMLVVKAIESLPSHIHLVAVGKSTPYAEKIKEYVKQKGLSEKIHFYHQVPFTDLPAFYQLASLFVYPSFFEGFGIPIIEALSSGVPVIGAKGSCLEEAGGPDSAYIDPNNEQELVLTISKILSDKNRMQEMINKGKEYVKRFDGKNIAEQLYSIYNRLYEDGR